MIFLKKILLLQICFILFPIYIFSQGELEITREPDKYNLNSIGFKLNSNGSGAYYSFSTRINYRLRRFFEAEYNYMKSPKEIKVVNPYFESITVKKFVFGKTYTVHNIKAGYGYNKMIFDKRDRNSVSIHLKGGGGVILAVSKPIYYEIVDSLKLINGYFIPYTSYYRIDINIQNNPTDIVGKAPFNLGLNEMKVHPGIYLKMGMSFDFSQDIMKSKVLETGVIYDYYLNPIEIIAGQVNSNFLYLYISYHFGKKYDAVLNREFRKDQRKISRQSIN
ncbi:MAG TPA: hypothetical protein PKN32_03375 [Bacteroidales bacterium]|nr:hypothetical protein [Bacteroidales bacterium]